MMARFKVNPSCVLSLLTRLYDGIMRVNSNRPPKPEQTLEGYVLTDSGDKAISHVVGSFFGAIFLGAGLFMFLSDGSLFAKFFSVPFIGLGGLFVVVPMVLLWRIRKLKPGQLVVSSWPLKIGDTTRVTYRRAVKRGAVPTLERIDAEVVVREVARYHQGTDTHTVEEDVARYRVEAHIMTIPGALVAELHVEIPANAPPSFHASNNRIEWWVEIEPVMLDGKTDESAFKLEVDA